MSIVVVARAADAETLAALHGQSIALSWDAAAFRKLLAGAETFALAAPAHRWDAFILARATAGEAEILMLATVPGARRLGLARALVAAAAAEATRRGADEIFLEVAADNIAALALYAVLGFVTAGLRPRYYVRAEGAADALTLKAALPLSTTGADGVHRGAGPPR